MVHELRKHGKKVATGVFVVVLGILGVAGGEKTFELIKTWITSQFSRGT